MTYKVVAPNAFQAKFLCEGEVLNDGTWLWRVEDAKHGVDGVVRLVVCRVGEGGRALLEFPEDTVVRVATDYDWVNEQPYYKVAA